MVLAGQPRFSPVFIKAPASPKIKLKTQKSGYYTGSVYHDGKLYRGGFKVELLRLEHLRLVSAACNRCSLVTVVLFQRA